MRVSDSWTIEGDGFAYTMMTLDESKPAQCTSVLIDGVPYKLMDFHMKPTDPNVSTADFMANKCAIAGAHDFTGMTVRFN